MSTIALATEAIGWHESPSLSLIITGSLVAVSSFVVFSLVSIMATLMNAGRLRGLRAFQVAAILLTTAGLGSVVWGSGLASITMSQNVDAVRDAWSLRHVDATTLVRNAADGKATSITLHGKSTVASLRIRGGEVTLVSDGEVVAPKPAR